MNMWSNNSGSRRRRRGGQRPAPESDPLDRDYGFGYSEEGRPITGISDGDVFDPEAEIVDAKGETTYHDLSKTRAIKMCAPDQHDLKQDGEAGDDIPGHVAMKCTRCPFGQIVPVK